MMSKKTAGATILAVLLAASNIVLATQVASLRKSAKNLNAKISVLEENIAGHQESEWLLIEKINSGITLLLASQKQSTEKLQGSLASISQKSDEHLSKTLDMGKTYEELLEEQKKKTLDTTAQDSAVSRMKDEANRLYSQKKYAAAYREYKKVLLYRSEDLECRLNKMKSLYYMNRADNSKYKEILEDIRILKLAGKLDEEADRIERLINAEQESANE